MDDLIAALQLAEKYFNDYGRKYPTGCDHDVMYLNLDTTLVSEADLARFEELSFIPMEDIGWTLGSFRFGSC